MQMVLTRELQANSRRPQTYHRRLIAAASVVAIIFLFTIFGATQQQNGAPIFYAILTIAFIVCSFEAINRSCSSITTEKEESTLGLLLLTRLTGHELLAGKFLSAVVASLQPVFAILPALAIPIFMGGVTGGDLAAASIALIHTVLLWLAAGIVSSAISKTTFEASLMAVISLGFIGGFLAVLAQIGGIFLAFNPITPLLLLFTTARGIEPWHVLTSIVITAAAIILILRSIGKNLANDWRSETAREAAISYSTPPPVATPAPAPTAIAPRDEPLTVPVATDTPPPRWFDGDPIAWLVLRDTGMHGSAFGRVFISCLLSPLILLHYGFGFFFGWIFLLIVALVSPTCAARARRASALELWLTTPLTENEIRAGYNKGLRQMFAWPAIILFGATGLRLFGEIFMGYSVWRRDYVFYIFQLYQFAMMIVAFFVIPRIGFFLGLKSKSPLAASLRTALFGVVLPWLLLPLPNFIYYPILSVIAQSGTSILRERPPALSFFPQKNRSESSPSSSSASRTSCRSE